MASDKLLDEAAHRIMYHMVHHFKTVAMIVEAEIAKYQATSGLYRSSDNEHPITSIKGGVPVEGLLATKAVSHFNLGTALELLFKLILAIEGKEIPKKHSLLLLFNQISQTWQRRVLSSYSKTQQGKPECLLVATQSTDSPLEAQPTGGKIDSLRGFLACFDNDLMVSEHRYLWEPIHCGRWAQFLDGISVFTDMIDRVMSKIDLPGVANPSQSQSRVKRKKAAR